MAGRCMGGQGGPVTNDDSSSSRGGFTFHVSRKALTVAAIVVGAAIIAAGAYSVGRFTTVATRHAVPSTKRHATASSAPAKASPTPATSAPPPTSTTSPTPTSTVPAHSVPALPPLPGAPPCGGVPGASSPEVRPTSLILACADFNARVEDISWASWGYSQAIGSGTFTENQCVPDCAQGTFTNYPDSSVLLDDPSDSSGVPIFQQVIVTPSGNAPDYVNNAPGAWGWAPS